jgi:hypothetical protein
MCIAISTSAPANVEAPTAQIASELNCDVCGWDFRQCGIAVSPALAAWAGGFVMGHANPRCAAMSFETETASRSNIFWAASLKRRMSFEACDRAATKLLFLHWNHDF